MSQDLFGFGSGASEMSRDEDGYLVNPNGNVWGYARVSTADQSLLRQQMAFRDYGVNPAYIFQEKITGKHVNRPEYKKLMKVIRKGDIIVIASLDRLGRNYDEIINQWKMITQDIGCGIHVLDMPMLNTSGDPADLMSRFITDMMLQVLSFVAETERTNMYKRQAQGLKALKEVGVENTTKKGRPKKRFDYRFWELYIVFRSGHVPAKDLAKIAFDECNCSERTFYRRMYELDQRYGDIEAWRLDDYIMDDFKEGGFVHDAEHIDWELNYPNTYDDYGEKIASNLRRIEQGTAKTFAESQAAHEQKHYDLERLVLMQRQAEFRKRFGLNDERGAPNRNARSKTSPGANPDYASYLEKKAKEKNCGNKTSPDKNADIWLRHNPDKNIEDIRLIKSITTDTYMISHMLDADSEATTTVVVD